VLIQAFAKIPAKIGDFHQKYRDYVIDYAGVECYYLYSHYFIIYPAH